MAKDMTGSMAPSWIAAATVCRPIRGVVQELEKVLFAHQPHLFAVPVRRAVDAFPGLGWRWDRLGNFEYSNASPDKSRGDPSKE